MDLFDSSAYYLLFLLISFFKIIYFKNLILKIIAPGVPGWLKASDFGSGHDLTVVNSSPALSSVLTAQSLEPAWNSVSPSLCPSPTHTLSLSKINKH